MDWRSQVRMEGVEQMCREVGGNRARVEDRRRLYMDYPKAGPARDRKTWQHERETKWSWWNAPNIVTMHEHDAMCAQVAKILYWNANREVDPHPHPRTQLIIGRWQDRWRYSHMCWKKMLLHCELT